jgi:phage shock protein PspC (stress-responsive transcriptional regulator)
METNSTAPEAGPAPGDAKGDSTSPGTGSPAAGAVGSAPTPNPDSTEFFDWFRRLGVPRRAGWLGGVCAGIGARLGIDPIIVRGIVVVVAVLGAPLVLLYAVAWLWLPDVDGEIHLERMLRGTVDPAIVGIAVMGVIGLISIMQGGWFGWRWWPDWPSFGLGDYDVFTPLRVLWVLMVVAGVIVLVIWLVRRAARTSPGGGDAARMASAPAAAASGTARFDAAAAAKVPFAEPVEANPAGSGTAAASPTVEPPIPAEGADAAALADWREQHEAWRRSRDDWKRSHHDAERAAAQAAAENKARAQELAARADEARRLRRAARPRASAAYVVTVLGLALVSGASASIWGITAPGLDEFATAIGLAAMTLVLAAGMFMAAVRRRRSGFLAFVATLATLGMLLAAAAPGRTLVPPSYGISMLESQVVVQPVGDAYLVAYEELHSVPGTPEIELTQGTGDVYLTITDGTQVELDASAAGEVIVTEFDADGTGRRTQASPGPDGVYTLGRTSGAPADVRLTVNQSQGGTIMVDIQEGTAR